MLFVSAACLFHALKLSLAQQRDFLTVWGSTQVSWNKWDAACGCVSGGCGSRSDCFSPKMTGPRQGASRCHNADGVIHLCKIQILYTQWTRHQQSISDVPVGQCDAWANTEACMFSQAEGRNQVINHTLPEATALVYFMLVKILQHRHDSPKKTTPSICISYIIKSHSSDI